MVLCKRWISSHRRDSMSLQRYRPIKGWCGRFGLSITRSIFRTTVVRAIAASRRLLRRTCFPEAGVDEYRFNRRSLGSGAQRTLLARHHHRCPSQEECSMPVICRVNELDREMLSYGQHLIALHAASIV